jgi:hypothetical protein
LVLDILEDLDDEFPVQIISTWNIWQEIVN